MITVGFSTRKINPTFVEYIKNTVGPKNVEIIPIENDGVYSLTQAYNMILDQASNDIVILCHDDIYFEGKGWGSNVLYHFQKNPEYGILGVAGTTHMPKSGQWWEDRSKMHGIVNHEHQGKKWESKYSNSLGKKIQDVVVVDGLFMCVNKNNITKNFNEEVKGFHMYDIDFCFRNFLDEVKVGVIYDVRVTHKSIGITNQEWEKNKNQFAETYKDNLPAKVLKKVGDPLNILVLIKDDPQYLLQRLEGFKLTIISEKKQKNYKNQKIYQYEESPGIMYGDGVKKINSQNGPINTIQGRLYRTSNLNYDLIVSDSDFLSNKFKYIYNRTPHLILKNTDSTHNSITCVKSIDIETLYEKVNSDLSVDTVKVISGYSDKGGSTTALSNLTKYFNQKGINCTFYGPNDYHLKLCKSDLLDNLKFEENDVIISHYLNLGNRPNVKKIILTSHEKWWFRPDEIPKYWDSIVFLHEEHRKYHSKYVGNYEIIPNFKENLIKVEKKDKINIAGVIGSIEERKQTHISIQRALNDNCDKVLIYGRVIDNQYFNNYVKPLISEKVLLMDFSENKQSMYDSIGRVYHSSKGEVACLIKDECYLTDTLFYGNDETMNEISKLTNDEIFDKWMEILKI